MDNTTTTPDALTQITPTETAAPAVSEPAPLPPPPTPPKDAFTEDLAAHPPGVHEQPVADAPKPPIGARVLYEFDDPTNGRRGVRPADVVNVNEDGTLDLFVLFHPHDRHCGMANQDPRIVLNVSHSSHASVVEDFYHRCWCDPRW